MQKIKIDRDWNFRRQAPSAMSVMLPGGETVDLPHDATIGTDVDPNSPNGNSTGWYNGCFANYNKHMLFPAEWQGKKVYLQLDGAYWCTEISLNGHLIDMHPNGYTPFWADLTEQVNFGENNRINLFVNNSQQRTGRWYTGSGVYRHVYLRVGEKLHLSPAPTFVSTECLEGSVARLKAVAEVWNESDMVRTFSVKVSLCPEDGGEGGASAQSTLTLQAGERAQAKLSLLLPEARLWSPASPALYTVRTELYENGACVDSDESLCGVRTVEITREKGMLLNGEPIKLYGGCVHSDNGVLGAVSLYDAEYRKVRIHKDAGYNALRCAHNPPSEDFLEVCDRLGMLVLDEFFDVWRMLKDPNDYHLFFDAWWKRDMELAILRDRAHPCVFMYSLGNEIGERNGLKGGYELARELAVYARSLDGTRPLNLSLPTTFNGLDDKDTAQMLQSLYAKMQGGTKIQNLTTEFSEKIFAEKTAPFAAAADVVGYNYIENRYEEDMRTFPERIFVETESYPRQSGYIWSLVEKYPCILGDFLWTSMDYLGEAALGNTIYSDPAEGKSYNRLNAPQPQYPSRTANCGDFDLTGAPRNQLAYRQAVWGSEKTFLEIVTPDKSGKDVYLSQYGWEDAYQSWTFPGFENQRTTAKIYSAAEEVELFVNGVSQGRKPCGKGCDFTATYEVIYAVGAVEAVSFRAGKEVSRVRYETVGSACKLVAEADTTQLKADGESLAFVRVTLADAQGRAVPHVEAKLTAQVSGAAALAGFGSAAPSTEENYTKGEFATHRGSALAVVRSGYAAGEAVLTVRSEQFGEVSVRLNIFEK